MLKQLYIKNFALIDSLDMDFYPGFSVMTGETGAGKSIILGAINLLLGQRAESKYIKKGSDKCVIEAHFDLSKYNMQPFFTDNDIEYDANDCILRRELTAAGKSRAFINDTPVPLSIIKQLGEQLIDIHSQHQNLLPQIVRNQSIHHGGNALLNHRLEIAQNARIQRLHIQRGL